MKAISVTIALPSLLLGAMLGCAHRRGQDVATMPSHTFGPDGIVARDGRLLPPRKHCPTCDYLGMKCPKCQAASKESEIASTQTVVGNRVLSESDSETLLRSLKTKPLPGSDTDPASGRADLAGESRRLTTPYAPVHGRRIPVPAWD
jgi:hypothetical protein